MKNHTLHRILIGTLFLTLLVPLFIVRNPLTDTFLATFFSQAMVFQLIVEIMLVTWIALAVNDKKYRPNWRHPVVMSVSVFMGLLIFSQFFSVDVEKSFWSVQDRMVGVIHYLHLWGWFLVLHSVLKNRKDLTARLIQFSTGVSVIVGVIAAAEWMSTSAGSITSTLSNPNHLAVYLLIHIFLAIWLFFHSKQRWYLLIPVLHLFVMWISGSRAGLLALVLASLIALALRYKKTNNLQNITKKFVVIVLIITAGQLLLFSYGQQVAKALPTDLSEKIDSIVGERLELWSIGFDTFLARPITGWGMDNFSIPFDQLRNPSIHTTLTENWYDRAHNQLLDVMIAAGVFGLVGFVLLWGTALYQLFKRKTKKDATLFVLLLTTFTYLFFQFDIFYSNILLFFVLAIIASTPSSWRGGAPEEPTKQSVKDSKIASVNKDTGLAITRNGKIFLILLLLTALPIMYVTSVRPFTKNLQKIHGVELLEKSVPLALAEFKDALSVTTHYEYNFRRQIAAEVFASPQKFLSSESEETYELLSFLGAELNESMQKNPQELRMAMAAFGVAHALDKFDPADNYLAESYAHTMRLMAPYRSEPYASLAIIAEAREDLVQAIEYYMQAIGFAYNESWRTTYTTLAASVWAKQGMWDEVTALINTLTTLKPNAMFQMVDRMAQGVQLDPNIPDNLVDLTILIVNNQSTNLLILERALVIFEAAQRPVEIKAVQGLINDIKL